MLRRFAIGLWLVAVSVGCLLLVGCNGISSASKSPQQNSTQGDAGHAIPSTFWGLIINKFNSYPLQVPYGQFRGWDSGGAQWPSVEACRAASGDPRDACF